MAIKCLQCDQELGGEHKEDIVASISGSIMGDENIDTYYYCSKCGVYTVEVYHDRFTGLEETSFRGPIAKAQGDIKVEIIRQCTRPWDKKCRCDAHRSYFGDWLD
jgi:hypothetical protein